MEVIKHGGCYYQFKCHYCACIFRLTRREMAQEGWVKCPECDEYVHASKKEVANYFDY